MDSYLMGRTAAEAERLEVQAAVYAPHSEHLLRLAGVGRGMRVLDVGCGPGDVTMLLARLVGPRGQVVGADIDEDMVRTARLRAKESGVDNVTFVRAAIPDIPVDGPFDAVVGRLILMHLKDPASAVRGLRGFVRPGGIVSFQEVDVTYALSGRAAPLAATCVKWCDDVATLAGSQVAGGRLVPILRDAGLEVAGMAVETPAAVRSDALLYRYFVSTVASLLPSIVALGVATEAEVGIGTLFDRLRAELRETHLPAFPPELAGAWAIESRRDQSTGSR